MYFIDEGTVKSARGEKNLYDGLERFEQISFGEVVSVNDPTYLGRIKVRIKGSRAKGGDDGIADKDLSWCFPLIPKFLSTQPKPKEAVVILMLKKDRQHTDRMYVGPIISQPDLLNFDPYYVTALAGFSFGSQAPNVSVATIPELNGVFPNPEDVSIQGRYNTDITQRNNEVIIRAGKFETITPNKDNPFSFKFNSKTQAYIQIKNDVVTVNKTDTTAEERGTVTNIVASKINLLTHKDGSPRFNITDQNDFITDEELAKIFESAHQLPFGDVLLEYLKLMKDAIFGHVHNGNGNPSTDLTASGNKQPLAVFKAKAGDLENKMLSKNIRIN